MRHLQTGHLLLFRILRDECLFLNSRQIQRILTRAKRAANKELAWLVSAGYLQRRYRLETVSHFQVPLYYLGKLGWEMVGNAAEGYRAYQKEIAQRSERQTDHLLAVYDVFLKFILESEVKQIIGGEDRLWQESLGFGNLPDGWIQSNGGEVFIEVDLGTERPGVVAKKFANYIKFKESGNYGLMFPGCGFKVLFITTTEVRIESLERLAMTDDIWFATMDEFVRERLDHQHWFAVNGFYALPVAAKKEV